MTISTSGAGGLDTGSEASNTWYYIWLIGKTDGTVSAMYSLSSSSPTMPSGYTLKRILPFAVRNNASSNLDPFMVTTGWPYRPLIIFRDTEGATPYRVLSAGSATTAFTNPGGGTNVNCSAIIPPISKLGFFYAETVYVGSSETFTSFVKNPDSASTAGQVAGTVNSIGNTYQQTLS